MALLPASCLPAIGQSVPQAAQAAEAVPPAAKRFIAVSAFDGDSAQEPPTQPQPSGPPSSDPLAGAAAETLHLSLQSALARGLAKNPDLVTLRAQAPVSEAMVDVAHTPLWNPFVQSQFLPRGTPFVPNNPGEPASGAGQSNYYVWAMQRFEVAHQRRYRTRAAMEALSQVQWNILQAELLNVAQSTRLYFTALYQKGLYELASETADLNERLLDVQRRRVAANLAPAADITGAQIAARQSRRQAEIARFSYETALAALRQQLSVPLSTALVLTERMADMRWLPVHGDDAAQDETAYAAELVEGRPDVMAAQVGIRVAEANLGLAHAAQVPDLQAGPIYETADDGTQYLGFRLQMEIPIWNTGRAMARQRKAELNQRALTHEQLKVKAGLEAQTAISQYERVRQFATRLAAESSSGPPHELDEITRLFEAGQADILAVIQTRNNLLQEQRTNLDLLIQLAQAAANVIQATALPVDHVIESSGAPTPAQGPTTEPKN
ncbi:MAG: hypothetical protein GC160_12495 [Acidobacteria bacterium]|nr:hypothetical protein [Acidobacteriota bacterium]